MDSKQKHYLRHGGDIYSPRRMKYADQILDFSANINPAGMPQEVIDALKQNISAYEHYPDPLCRELRAAIAKSEHIPASSIFCGNGATDLIYRIVQGVKPKTAMVTSPTFSEYEAALETVDCKISYYELPVDDRFELTDDILKAIKPGLGMLFLCNPNNPTGVPIEKELVGEIAQHCQECGTILVVDECFIGFLERENKYSATEYISEYQNLIVLKAFTKIYAMAGLRLGYLLCRNHEILDRVRRVGQPWNVSTVASKCGVAALGARKHVKLTKQLVSANRAYLTRELNALGYIVFPSKANFILIGSEDNKLDKKLADYGILIRPCSNYRGLNEHYFRIAVRTMKENEYLVECLEKIAGQKEKPAGGEN